MTHAADFVPCFVAFETNVRSYADTSIGVSLFHTSIVFAKECRWVHPLRIVKHVEVE